MGEVWWPSQVSSFTWNSLRYVRYPSTCVWWMWARTRVATDGGAKSQRAARVDLHSCVGEPGLCSKGYCVVKGKARNFRLQRFALGHKTVGFKDIWDMSLPALIFIYPGTDGSAGAYVSALPFSLGWGSSLHPRVWGKMLESFYQVNMDAHLLIPLITQGKIASWFCASTQGGLPQVRLRE